MIHFDSNDPHICFVCTSMIGGHDPKVIVCQQGKAWTMHPECYAIETARSNPYLDLWTNLVALLHDEELLRLCKRISMRKEVTVAWLRLSEALFTEIQTRDALAQVVAPPLPSAYE